MMDTGVVIIGGGLSGLSIACQLASYRSDFIVLEARGHPGGRILSEATTVAAIPAVPAAAVDLGPAWFWPGQHRVQSLIQDTGLAGLVCEQFSSGQSVVEYAGGELDTGHGNASMAGSYRLDGGLMQLTNCLTKGLQAHQLFTKTTVVKVSRTDTGIMVTAKHKEEPLTISAKQVVLALPPRVIADTIAFAPVLPAATTANLRSKATWMAAHAKFVAVFSSPFWREHGLSGDGLSQKGPLVEIHDASPKSGGPWALFGFVGVPARDRAGQDLLIVQLAIEQINRMFGGGVIYQPISTHYKDWAYDSFTATQADRDAPATHHGMRNDFNNEWDNRVIFAGTETAVGQGQSNGYLEGALESAERAISFLNG